MASVQAIDSRTKGYLPMIDKQRSHTIATTHISTDVIPYSSKHQGKVRDVYRSDEFIVMIATDRQSAFDRQLASVPFKGQVLNQTSKWWFSKTAHIVPNHAIAFPHPNITIGKKCTVFPIEFVMRGYMTGTTSTSIWTNYQKGMRFYCGHSLPEGMVKNQKLEKNLLTPTTKDDVHDELISAEEIIASARMTKEDWEACARYAEELFDFSQKLALEKGLILVDTKYEFGRDESGTIILIDEIQTPDSYVHHLYSFRFEYNVNSICVGRGSG
jgi:phosphoribosylaminoimidazole-succinocarboxamide synthase